MESIVYSRERERTKPLKLSKKLIYGIGELPYGLLDSITGTFLMLYYVQIMGVSASSIGVLIGLAFLLDALTDPILAEFSDRLRSRLGRRHGLMYASSIPFGLCVYCLMSPPEGLDNALILIWVGFFLVLTRLCYTVFSVPYEALLPELGGDYEGRASLAAWRRLSAWLVSTIGFGFVMLFIFAGSDAYPQGQLNPDAYPAFALFTGLGITICILVVTHFTRDQIPHLLQPQVSSTIKLRMLVSSIASVVAIRNFQRLMCGVLLYFSVQAVATSFDIFVFTYFWQLTTEDLFILQVGGMFGAVTGILIATQLVRRFQKHHLLIVAIAAMICINALIPVLRLGDVFPSNNSLFFLPLLSVTQASVAFFGTLAGITSLSMFADLVDEHALSNGRRQEAMFSAGLTFGMKAAGALGVMISGILLEHFIGFDSSAVGLTPNEIEETVLFKLAITDALILNTLLVFCLVFFRRYTLTKESVAQIQIELANRTRTSGL
jgi:Na+/melibiose symporter-like transporter